MKKISLLFAFLLISSGVFAQGGFGIKGGLNLSDIVIDDGTFNGNFNKSYDSKTGTVWGVWGRIGKNKVYVQPEAVLALSSGKLTIPDNLGGPPEVVNVKYSNVEVPVLIGFKPLNFIRIMAGPTATVNISESANLKEALNNYTDGDGDVLEDITYGYQLGAGIKLLGLELDVRKVGGFSNFINAEWATEDKFNTKKDGWQVTLAIKLF